MRKRVVIIKEGQWGMLRPEDYEGFTHLLKNLLEEERINQEGRSDKPVVTFVETAQDAYSVAADVAVFVSRGIQREAEKLKKMRPKTKVVVLTGLVPEDVVIYVNKAKAYARPGLIQEIILEW